MFKSFLSLFAVLRYLVQSLSSLLCLPKGHLLLQKRIRVSLPNRLVLILDPFINNTTMITSPLKSIVAKVVTIDVVFRRVLQQSILLVDLMLPSGNFGSNERVLIDTQFLVDPLDLITISELVGLLFFVILAL